MVTNYSDCNGADVTDIVRTEQALISSDPACRRVIWDESIAAAVAKVLVANNCVALKPFDEPAQWYRLASGELAPIIVRVRSLVRSPEATARTANWLAAVISVKFPEIVTIAGAATAGIPWAALTAERIGYPFCWVRREAKQRNPDDGRIDPPILERGANVILIDDLVNGGRSAAAAVAALENEAGAVVIGIVAIASWARQRALDLLDHRRRSVVALTSWPWVISALLDARHINAQTADKLAAFYLSSMRAELTST